ncbi:MAG: YhjD/YihY/BrkB family envelope integrity protein [Phycisphaerales bacterium]
MVARALSTAKHLAQRLGHGITHPEQELDRLQRAVVYSYDLARHGWKMLLRDNAPLMAAALAYRTLFSAVPVLVLALVVARSFYGEEGIRSALNQVMQFTGVTELTIVGQADMLDTVVPEAASPAPAPEPAPTAAAPDQAESQIVVAQLIEQWVNNAVTRMTTLNYGAITAISVLVFIYAALILLVQVEESFNTITQAARGRRWLTRLTTYWTLLTLGSVGVGATVAISRLWIEFTSQLPGWLAWAGGAIEIVGKIGVVWLLLLFAYLRMPNSRVRLRPAAIGAVVAAILWEFGKGLLVWFIKKSAGGQLEVYGPIALIPILLFWLYCTWYIILFGLEVAWAIQTVGEAKLRERDEAKKSRISVVDPSAAVAVMQHLAQAFTSGQPMRTDQISRATRIPEVVTQQLTSALCEAGLLHRVATNGQNHPGPDDEAFALARPPETIHLDTVLAAAFRLTPIASGAEPTNGGTAPIESIRQQLLDAVRGKTLAP